MSRAVDRRSVFFLCAALASLVTIVITPAEYHWVGYVLAVVYVLLAIGSFLDHRSRGKFRPRG